MTATFCAMVTAYLLGAVLLQEVGTIESLRAIWRPVIRGVVVTALACLLLGTFQWRILLALLLTLTVMAAIEERLPLSSGVVFFVDKSLHFAALLGLTCYCPLAAQNGWWITSLRPDLSKWYFAVLSCVSGIIVCVPAGGVLIAKLIRPFADEIRDSGISGLTQGGRYIGWLERILVMLLVLSDQPNGIGFLIAAKSILRFGEIKDASQRKVAEYIIIGTFLSFGWALLISVLTQKAIRYWVQ